ncbi:MAG: lipo-like protein [Gammaproteobacteria bacterium]|nr:lipo-like protein [Gammaproteobacteria bacterium]MBL4728084.1 lipo-like protein [Gammaproteobacteria bacterium]
MLNSLKRAIGERLAAFLSKDLPGYQRLDTLAIADVAMTLEKGDIVLVDGNTRISTAIKYLTQSTWSHACLYVGEKGADSSQLNLLEADLKNGVHLTNLNHYASFNLRICRPVNLSDEEAGELVDFAQQRIGHQYDLKNVVDLIRYVIQKPAVPNRYRRSLLSLGSGEPTKAICSTLIAESFQSINYPILPRRNSEGGQSGEVEEVRLLYKRHFTHFTPRDFDLSPYFRIVKPTIESGFDHHSLAWEASDVEAELNNLDE